MIKKQFYKRLRHELGRKWKSIRSITDWTVALYIIIPALIFMGIYYRSLWMEELSIGETVYFGLGLLVFYVITYARGVRSFFEQADSLFLISYPVHMKKVNPVWHDIYVYSNSDSECSGSSCYVTSFAEKYWSDEGTSRIILAILYYISIYVVVINEIYSCTCGETMVTMGYQKCNIFYKSILFLE